MAIVEASLVDAAFAKINLTLRVLGRRADGYHELESLVAFAGLADTLTLQLDAAEGLEVSGPFASLSGPASSNLVLKARDALRQRSGGMKAGLFLLEKNIPVAAGIGGGSADAAAALRLLARANGIALDDPRLREAARDVGADVPVCLESRARSMRGVGEKLSAPFKLPPLPAVLVNPGIPLATRDVFARYSAAPSSTSLGDPPRDRDALIEYLKQHGNDLTQAATACAPVVDGVLAALNGLPGVRLVRMSGSGATCFALFSTEGEAVAAARTLQAAHKAWWVCLSVIS